MDTQQQQNFIRSTTAKGIHCHVHTEERTKRGDLIIGRCSMDDLTAFNNMSRELKGKHGTRNVWFDRDDRSRTITFLTH